MDIDITGTAVWTKASHSYAWISDPTDIDTGTLYLGNGGNTNWGIEVDGSGTWNGGLSFSLNDAILNGSVVEVNWLTDIVTWKLILVVVP